MKFSPYKSRNDSEQTSGTVLDDSDLDASDQDYFTDDSEEFDYPVRPRIAPSSAAVWQNYNRITQSAVKDGLDVKIEKLLTHHLGERTRLVESTRHSVDLARAEVDQLARLLRDTELQQAAEDEERKAALKASNAGILDSVARSIQEHEAIEKARADKLAKEAAQERMERARQEEQRRQKQNADEEASRARKEEEARRIVAEEQKSRKEMAEKVAKSEQEKTEAAQAKAQAEREEKALAAKEEAERSQAEQTPKGESIKWQKELAEFKLKVLKPVSESSAMKSFCARARLRLNARVGQVTRSITVIKEVSAGIKSILDEARTKDSEGLVLAWSCNSLCKALVKQAETEVMVNPTAAYPLAFLITTLFASFPDMLRLYLMRIAKKCPWTIPFVEFDKGLESGRKSLGYRRGQEGSWEAETAYMERQTGIFRLWAATVSLDVRANPLPISNGWRLIARLVNADIDDNDLKNVAFNIISTFLEISGKTFTKVYGPQATKMVRAIALWVGPDARGGNATRLRTLIEDYIVSGHIGLDFAFEA